MIHWKMLNQILNDKRLILIIGIWIGIVLQVFVSHFDKEYKKTCKEMNGMITRSGICDINMKDHILFEK